MCGIFGYVSNDDTVKVKKIRSIIKTSESRGKDASGLVVGSKERNESYNYDVYKIDQPIKKLINSQNINLNAKFIIGHTRLITNGSSDNQPVISENALIIHNGIVTNEDELWNEIEQTPKLSIDTEIILKYLEFKINSESNLENICEELLTKIEGTISIAVLLPKFGKLILLSNNGSLFLNTTETTTYFASENYTLEKENLINNIQLNNNFKIIDIPNGEIILKDDIKSRKNNLIPEFIYNSPDEKLLEYSQPDLLRCKKCILPNTMPFITFNDDGVCNYCTNYTPRNNPKPKELLLNELEKYRRQNGPDCLVPFSGGRDSCMGLDIIINELGMKPITYTYDWGMVTDLGRRNISRMCSKLNVENIIVAADIHKKRDNIRKNIIAWLENPHLGMVNIFTAGDKHFFRYVEKIKKQTGINLNIWSVNPLEVTHFKAGFLGMPPAFLEDKVYYNGVSKQLKYHSLRFREMLNSKKYFNLSIFDTLQGEYYRSFMQKNDYYHLFDYWKWDEKICDQTLLGKYDWEKAPDTNTTWRIGDGTAAFYNYIYYTVAGFSEHDTFRSNQVREGDISRDEALSLALDENKPRFQNLRWYLDCVDLEFSDVISRINKIPKLYETNI